MLLLRTLVGKYFGQKPIWIWSQPASIRIFLNEYLLISASWMEWSRWWPPMVMCNVHTGHYVGNARRRSMLHIKLFNLKFSRFSKWYLNQKNRIHRNGEMEFHWAYIVSKSHIWQYQPTGYIIHEKNIHEKLNKFDGAAKLQNK